MTTLKLNKKSSDNPTETKLGEGKKPVRRVANELRDRTKAPPKPAVRADEGKPSTRGKSEGGRERNHGFDGKPRERDGDFKARSSAPRGTGSRDVGQRDARQKDAGQRDLGRSDARSDTRVSPRKNREEPHYRQAPRRGGKVRDGYDASQAYEKNPIAKQAAPETTNASELPRLSKVMADRGLCSRREADDWIVNGWVKVDGEIIEALGTRVSPDAEILISGYAKEHQAENVTILLHKPVGYVSGQAEDGYEPAVVLIHPDNQWEEDPTQKMFQRGFLKGLAPAGRLDIDSTGLLVLTQDGRVARHLIGEDSKVEKEYLVRVEGVLSDDGLRKLNHGLSLDGVQLKPAKVSWQNEDQLRFVLREGRKRQIRRMCELVGLKVVGLKRIRIGSVTLGKLPAGQWRYLQANERF